MASTDRHTRGLKLLEQIAGPEQAGIVDAIAALHPDIARYTVEFAYGDVYARPGLTLAQRQLATVAALAALGNAAPQLRFHIGGALNAGCTPTEIVEACIHLTVYAGFPAALNALTATRQVLAERGLTMPPPPATGDAAGGERGDGGDGPGTAPDRYGRGWAALAAIDGHAGEQVVASLADIAPDLGRYIVEFAFGDVYTRPGLDLKTRELVTVAACTALGTATPQLKVHVRGFLNVGGTEEELVEILLQMAVYAGFPAALNALTAAKDVLTERT